MRLVHTADVHLDTPFPGRTEELRARLQAASRAAFRSVVQLALDERADALVIAGDLFDGERLSFSTERFLADEITRLGQAGVTVVYATGNHDAASVQPRTGVLDWPDNVALAAGPTPQRFPIFGDDERVAGYVTAIGHENPQVTDDLSLRLERRPSALPEVAVLHTQVHRARGSNRHEPYAPSELAHLMRAGYDYWALGHVHQRQTLWTDPLVCYSGNPQGRNFNETGPRGCLFVDLRDRSAPLRTFHETASVRFEILRVDGLDGLATLDALVRRVAQVWEGERSADPGASRTDWVVRVELEGPSPLAGALRDPEERATLSEEIGVAIDACWVEVWGQHTHAPVDIGAHSARDDALGEALRLIERLQDGAEPIEEVIDLAELAGVDASAGTDPTAYARELLDGLPAEALTRLLDPATQEGTG